MMMGLLGVGGGGRAGGGGGATDPFFSNVVLLWEAEGTNGQNSGVTDLKNGRAITFSGTAKLDTAQALYGSTSLFVGGSGVSLADNNDWDLSDANSDQFTIEISGKQTSFSVWDIIANFGSPGSWAWLCRWADTGEMTFYWSPDGSSLQSLSTSGAGATSTSAWYDWCIEKNASGKIRIYLNGVMKASSTPADSTIFNASAVLYMGSQAFSTAWLDHVRITKGVARYNSDSGYTQTTGPFPTS